MTDTLSFPELLDFSNPSQLKQAIAANASLITLVPLSSWKDISFVKELSEHSVLKHFKLIEDTNILQDKLVIQNLFNTNIFHIWDLPPLFFTHLESIYFALGVFFNKMEKDSWLRTVYPLHESIAADIWYNFPDYDKFMDENISENDHLGQLEYFFKSVDAFFLDKQMQEDLETINSSATNKPTIGNKRIKKF